MTMVLKSPQSWMRLIESSNVDVSGASEVPQSRGKLIFLEVQLYCVFAQKLISLVKIRVNRDRSKY